MLNFSCLPRRAMLAAAFLGLAACTARDAGWQRPNTSDATRAADYRDCRGEAKSLTGPALGIDQDIASSRGSDWEKSGQYTMRSEQNSGSDADSFSEVLSSCMVDKGYQRR
jgi:hypothetical protein